MKVAETRRHPGRSGTEWNRVRAQVLATSSICWLCGKAVDFDAPPRSRWSPSVDHVLPISKMRHLPMDEQKRLALDPTLLRTAHYGHNSGRGNRKPTRPRRRSRSW